MADITTPYHYRFGPFELDEAHFTFKQNGVLLPMPAKPWTLLLLLLQHAPRVVTYKEIDAFVWAGRSASAGTVNQVLVRLRQFLQDEDQALIKNARGVGFCFTGDFERKEQIIDRSGAQIEISAATKLRGRQPWKLLRPLRTGGNMPIWLGEHQGTGEQRAFKIAFDAVGKSSLKKEVLAARLLADERASGFLPILHWDFTETPYFIETPFIDGLSLADWVALPPADATAAPEQARAVTLIAEVADVLESAHISGIVHGDLSLQNVLVRVTESGVENALLHDFGSAQLAAVERIRALELSLPLVNLAVNTQVGRLIYAAPEALRGEPITPATDVYALGVMLFQCLARDSRRTFSPGWESAVSDPLLREDILAMCQTVAQDRPSAGAVCQRLSTLSSRHQLRSTQLQLAAQTRSNLANRGKRRRYLAAICLLGALFSVATLGWLREQQRAEQQSQHLAQVNQQLTRSDDTLASNVLLFMGHAAFDKIYQGATLASALLAIMADVDRDLIAKPDLQLEVFLQLGQSLQAIGDVESAGRALEKLHGIAGHISKKTALRIEFSYAVSLHLNNQADAARAVFERLAAEFTLEHDQVYLAACNRYLSDKYAESEATNTPK
jgi:eukaryotic-like serine/threonine-protein kinase